MQTTTEPERTTALRELIDSHLVDGSRFVATIMQAPADTYGNVLRGVVVHVIPDPYPGQRPYPVPVAASSGHFIDGVQLVAFALLARITGEYPGTDSMDEHRIVGDAVSILPTVYVKRQRDVTEAVEHAARAISQETADPR